MSDAAKSNVLLFVSAVMAATAVWCLVAVASSRDLPQGLLGLGCAIVAILSFRSYRKLLRRMDEAERRSTG